MIYPYAVTAFGELFQSFNELIEALLIDQHLKNAVLRVPSSIVDHAHNKPIDHRLTELFIEVKWKRLPAISQTMYKTYEMIKTRRFY